MTVAGYSIALNVQGTFVGEGAPVKITLRDARNRIIGGGKAAMHRDRATVDVEIDRRAAERDPDGILAAADIEIADLGLEIVSAPLLVLPFAELSEAKWSADRSVQGATVSMRCRIDGSRGGVERLSRERAEVAVSVETESGVTPLAEPVVRLTTTPSDGRIDIEWTVTLGLDRWDLVSQSELDALADRAAATQGAAPYLYDRPHLLFHVYLGGMKAVSGPLAVDDWNDLALHDVGGEPVADVPYTLLLADGTERTGTLDAAGKAREEDLPPGPVRVTYDTSRVAP